MPSGADQQLAHVPEFPWENLMFASSSAPNSKKHAGVARAKVIEQLERILAHPLFQRSKLLSTFLRYAVERTLAGEGDRLKEFVIGAEALKRGDRFDPTTDNVVRVSANRLRSKLLEYYHGSGQSDPLVIYLPRGGYVPFFSTSRVVEPTPPCESRLPTARTNSVGRQHELDQIRSAFKSVAGGRGFMVTISGDAGMGKTTLVKNFLTDIESLKDGET
jgi:hypothetical protein